MRPRGTSLKAALHAPSRDIAEHRSARALTGHRRKFTTIGKSPPAPADPHVKQLTLATFEKLPARAFGGALTSRNAREQRPISSKRPMHLVLRSSLAKRELSLIRRARTIEAMVRRLAASKDVRIYRFANAGNHLHLIVLSRDRRAYRAFIRAITGLIPRLLGWRRPGRFWDRLPFTLIIEWGRQFRSALAYVLRNELEAEGRIPYRPRRTKPPPASSNANPRAPAPS